MNPRQKRFCEEYVIDNNGAQAAIRAGYSKKGAKQVAAKLLTYVDLKKYILELTKPIELDLKISAERVLRCIAEIAFNSQSEKNRIAALKLLGEHLKLFTQMHESTMTFQRMEMITINGRALIPNIGKPVERKSLN